MIPQIENVRTAASQPSGTPVVTLPPLATPLKLQFIRLGNGHVTGTLEPYTDPDCGCRVTTTFEGTFSGPNRIEGTYVTKGIDLFQHSNGRWTVKRQQVATTSTSRKNADR
jgi:hypothetical protein